MSAGGAFGGNRGVRPVPPEKGVFPLDHMHECDLEKKEYINCLKSSGHKSENCRRFSKRYLECRMEKRLREKGVISDIQSHAQIVINPIIRIPELKGDANRPAHELSKWAKATSVLGLLSAECFPPQELDGEAEHVRTRISKRI